MAVEYIAIVDFFGSDQLALICTHGRPILCYVGEAVQNFCECLYLPVFATELYSKAWNVISLAKEIVKNF